MNMIPLRDDTQRHGMPAITIIIIALCTVVFLYEISLPPGDIEHFIMDWAVIASNLTGNAVHTQLIPAWLTPLTSMFLHGSVGHLLGNMLYLWIFGDNIEIDLGRKRFILLYIVSGYAAAMTQMTLTPESALPMIGASGAVSGILGAYMMRYPLAQVRVLIPFFVFWKIINVRAYVLLAFWFLLQLGSGLMPPQEDIGGVAFWAHVGGFITGALFIFFSGKNNDGDKEHRWPPRRKGPWG